MTIRGINRRTCGQENLDNRWGLSLSREMQRRPARIVDCLRGGTSGQEHPQAIRVPIGSRIVHRRRPNRSRSVIPIKDGTPDQSSPAL